MSRTEIIAGSLVPGTRSVFFLGCFEERVTLYSQQVRALNLVDAILGEGLVRTDGKVAIVGGGAAGMTAAVAFAKAAPDLQGVDIYEKGQAVMGFQHGSLRYLHPHSYDWPAPGATDPVAGLPILNWRAGKADGVRRHLHEQFDRVRRESVIQVRASTPVRSVHPHPLSQVRVDVDGSAGPGETYDAVILSIGFGLERSIGGDTPSYWSPSGLEASVLTPGAEVFVSGNGDGGLVDFMTAALDAAFHEEVHDLLSGLDLGPAAAELDIIEREAWSPGASVDIHEAYQRRLMPLVPPAVHAAIGDRLRAGVKVRFHTNEPRLFKRTTAVLNRLGCALVLAADRNRGHDNLSTIVGREFVGEPPLTGPILIQGEAPFTPWRRFLRIGPDSAANIKPFEKLAAAVRAGAAGAPEGLRPAAPRLTKEAAATFGGFVSPAGREEAGGRGAAASGEEGRGRRGENFVVDPNPRTLPARLRTTSPFFYREGELARLAALFNHPRRDGMLVVLSGETLSGKTDLMRRFATTLAEQQGTGLALLHVDLAGANWPLRALFLSVRGPDQFTGPASGAGAGVPEEDDDLEDLQLRAAEFISSHIPHHLSGRRLVCFFERFHSIAGKQASVDQVRGILESGTFGAAFNILESRSPVSPTPGLPPVEIPLGAFEAPQAIEFLASLGIGRDPAGEALAMVPGEDILLPGILVGAANTFVGAPHPVSPPDLAMALIRTTSEIAWDAVKRVCDGDGLAPGPAMLSLMAISAFDGISMPRDMLEKVGLAEAPWRSLQRLDWARASEGVALHGFGQDAVRAAATVVLAHDRDPLVRADELIQAIERVGMELFSDGRVRASPVLDGTVAWLKRHAPGASGLRSRLEAILEQDAVGDAVSPLPPEEEREAAPGFLQQGRDGDLDAGLAALLLYARAPYDLEAADGAQKAAFVDSLETATALVRGRGRLNARQLGALDTALFVGSRRFHLFQEALKAREAVIAALEAQEPEARAAADQTWIAAWLSLLLGAADGALGVGRIDDARALTTRAIRTVEETDSWWRPGSWKHWMLARLALLRERLAAGLAEQKAALLDAAEHGLECVLLTRGDPRCVRFYLRVVRRLVHTEREDPLRKEHVDAARLHLERILGASDRWNVSVRAQFAALMRVEARRAWDQLYQKTRATDALKLLWTGRAGGREEVEGEPRACLVQARLQAFLGDRPAALKSCNRSIELAPTPSAWNLKLRLLDGADGGERDWAGEPLLRLAGAAPGISGPLRAAIKELVEWTRQERAWTRSYGKVLLWTIQRKWRAQGSIERWVAQQAERRGISYATLQAAEKIKLLTPAHNQREAELKAIEKRFGPSIPLTLARFETKAQYIRSVSVVTGKEPDQDAALRVIDEGLARWPGSHILQFAKAEYQRYTWRHEAAIVGFRSVMGAATSGDLRRRAAAALARTLHIVAANLEEEETRTALLREAQALATELVRSDEDPQSIAILRDHIAFELGEEVDWSSLEDVFERVIGRIDGIRNILFGDFDDVLSQEGPAPESLAEALKTNYADPDTLGLAGLLYLRRAETGRGNNRPEDFRRAVALFRSEALIERSWEGSERAVTSFRNARAILSAAEAFGTVNPIEGLTTEGKADQLAVAEAKFNSTATRTTGDFRSAARKYQGIASRLGASLRAGP